MSSDVLTKTKKVDFQDLLLMAKKYKPDINVDHLCNDYFGDNILMPSLYEKWYKSIEAGKYDYSIYDDDAYLIELFHCWRKPTLRTIKDTAKIVQKFPNMFKNVRTVLDLGCGIAYTTVALSDIFENANIIGTNLYGTLQYKVCEDVCSQYDRCSMIPDSDTTKLDCSVDVICAFEFFEHLESPLELLSALLTQYSPGVLLFVNSFTHMSLGHFKQYYIDGTEVTGRDVNKAFYNILKNNGYEHIETGMFWDRPQFWVKTSSIKQSLF